MDDGLGARRRNIAHSLFDSGTSRKGEFEKFGINIDHDERYGVAEELIVALRNLWETPEKKTIVTDHITLKDTIVSPGPDGEGPRFYLGGASPKALGLAGRQSDVLLMWIQPLEDTAALIERAVERFEEADRQR